MEKVWVEAESTPDGAVLSLKDVRQRRSLQKEFGQHNVSVPFSDLQKMGFPPRYIEDLNKGRPVQFKMNHPAYVLLLADKTSRDLEGYNQPDYNYYVVIDDERTAVHMIESGWSFKEDAEEQIENVKGLYESKGAILRVFSSMGIRRKNLDPNYDGNWWRG